MINPEERNFRSYLRTIRGDFTEMENATAQSESNASTPTNVSESDEGYRIQVALPGYRKDQIQLKVEEDILSIRAEVKSVRQQAHEKYHKQEIFSSSFQKNILLPEDVSDDNIKASFKDGLLNIELPKSAQPVKSSIEIAIK